ncbi:FecR family protein [Leeuwenhoekiella aestuarii]|nr:FecR domain-containing protein [Leeuwenhoekiella aestuarii]
MLDFKEIIAYCKSLSNFILKGKENTANPHTDLITKEDQDKLFRDFNDRNYWAEREKILGDIDVVEDWKALKSKIYFSKSKKQNFLKYAAAAILLIGFGLGVFYNLPDTFKTTEDPSALGNNIVSGSDKAILGLENGEEIELSKETVYKGKNSSFVSNHLLYTKDKNTGELVYNYLTIPRGGKFFVELSDGTQVWLNSESKLKYPVQFIAGQPRTVELVYGEAYFNVSHSTQHDGDSFIVKQKEQELEVLGTEFNISAYKNDKALYTTLVEGSVAIHNKHSSKVLKPGEQAVNMGSDNDLVITKVDVNYAIAWKDGIFLFRDEPLQAMMHQLSRWYDAEVDFENDVKKNYLFSGTLKREDDIQTLLQNLEKTGEVTFEIKDKKIMIK